MSPAANTATFAIDGLICSGAQERDNGFPRHGRSEIEPLHLLTVPILQKTKLFGRFNTLGCYLAAEHTREIDDQLYDRRCFGAGSERMK